MKLSTLIALVAIAVGSHSHAATLSGKVVDSLKQPLVGVSVITDVPGIGTKTNVVGEFALTYPDDTPVKRVTFSSVGYQPKQFLVAELPSEIMLQSVMVPGEDVLVSATRAQTGLSPVAYSNFTANDIDRDYLIDEFPLMLESTPNYYAFSYAGGGLNATEFKIRGFDSKRIAVYIDGIPLNDPEDHYTYFVDLPDYASEATDVQVQRGVGYSQFGDAAFGGTINIASAQLSTTRKVTLTSGYGRFYEGSDFISEMRRGSVEFASGLLDGRWMLDGRYSKQYSGGYRDETWYEGFNYSLAMSRVDPRMTTTLKTYGGPIRYHMAYYAIDTGQLRTDRRTNPTDYDNETDNFNQPHYELHNTYQLSEKSVLRNTLFYVRGKGFYEQYYGGANAPDFNIQPPQLTDSTDPEIDLVYQQWVNKNQWGWSPRVDIENNKWHHAFGGSFYYFNSEHWGQVTWAENLLNSVPPQNRYYEWFGKKYFASAFIHETFAPTDRLRLIYSLGLKYIRRDFDQTEMGAFAGYEFDTDWLFVSPRVGFTYQLTKQASLFASAAITSREPDDGAIYDANDPGTIPLLEITGDQLSDSGNTIYSFGDPLIKPERVYNFEIGTQYRTPTWNTGLNLYWMEFRNEIVQEGGIDDLGNTNLGNAKRSVHAGIEISAARMFAKQFTLSGNAAWSYNRLKKYEIQRDIDWDGVPDTTIDLSDNPTAGFPDLVANLIADLKIDPVRLVYRFRAVGRQYIENGGQKNLSIDPYTLSSVSASVFAGSMSGFGKLTLTARMDNLFDELYEVGGYAYDNDGDTNDDGFYYVGGERTFFVQLRLDIE